MPNEEICARLLGASEPAMRTVITPGSLTDRLQELGWIDFDSTDSRAAGGLDLFRAVSRYQQHHGLRSDGIAGPVTARHLAAPRFCKHPDVMPLRGRQPKWPHRNVSVCWDGQLLSVSREEVLGCLERALRSWALVSALRPVVATNPKTANLLLVTGVIDGSGKVLAYQELPYDVDERSQRNGVYDRQEPWWGKLAPPPTLAYVDLESVFFHECGHGWGLDHAPGDGAAMSALYAALRSPQEWDRRAIGALYPGPVLEVPSTPTPPPGTPATPPPASSQRVLIAGNFTITHVT